MNKKSDMTRVSASIIALLEIGLTLRSLSRTMTIMQVEVFLEVAKNRRISIGHIANNIGIDHSTVSRIVKKASKGRNGGPGIGLLKLVENPKNPRSSFVVLTNKGVNVVQQLRGILNTHMNSQSGE